MTWLLFSMAKSGLTDTNPVHQGSSDLISLIIDPHTWDTWDTPIDHDAQDDRYAAALKKAQADSGCDESVTTGRATIDGYPVALIVGEFRFLAGSIGHETARRIVTAIRRATAERLPLIGVPASGGTRMQEGTPAFVQMVNIAAAIAEHTSKGLPYLAYLRHPTTGGVYATWGSLGQVTWAEPNALIGFLGPRVFERLHHKKFPDGVQRSDNLHSVGIIDDVVCPQQLRQKLAQFLRLMTVHKSAITSNKSVDNAVPDATPSSSAWDSIVTTRKKSRVGAKTFISHYTDDALWLSGTHDGGRNDTVIFGLCRWGGHLCIVVGTDRIAERDQPLTAAGLRQLQRAARLADEWKVPLITFVDTDGAELSVSAEESAIAGEIARSITTLVTLNQPSISVIMGRGSGGGALAFLPADVVVSTADGWLAALSPEGASEILYRDVEHAPQLAESQRVSAHALAQVHVVDHVVEIGDASTIDGWRALHETVMGCLAQLSGETVTDSERHRRRYHRLDLWGYPRQSSPVG